MVKALFDTNILIDFLNAVPAARTEMSLYDGKAISIISWMEVLIGAQPEVEAGTREFLNGFEIIGLTSDVAGRAVALRRKNRIRLPDAVIWATADIHSLLLVTRNEKDFPEDTPGIRVPYRLR